MDNDVKQPPADSAAPSAQAMDVIASPQAQAAGNVQEAPASSAAPTEPAGAVAAPPQTAPAEEPPAEKVVDNPAKTAQKPAAAPDKPKQPRTLPLGAIIAAIIIFAALATLAYMVYSKGQ
jgi:hypothetical protein